MWIAVFCDLLASFVGGIGGSNSGPALAGRGFGALQRDQFILLAAKAQLFGVLHAGTPVGIGVVDVEVIPLPVVVGMVLTQLTVL